MKRWEVPAGSQPPPVPGPGDRIAGWLKRLRLLHGVPLGHLVPDEALLPPESFRVFTLDRGWVDALCDGALSLRPASGADTALRAAAMPAGGGPVTGFLLRSELVWRWPTLVARAFAAGDVPLDPVRVERLSPDVLLGLYAGELVAVTLAEPAETLHFGIERSTVTERGPRVLDVEALAAAHANGDPAFSPADLAVELIQDVDRVRLGREP